MITIDLSSEISDKAIHVENNVLYIYQLKRAIPRTSTSEETYQNIDSVILRINFYHQHSIDTFISHLNAITL